jgi:hypothetical protein
MARLRQKLHQAVKSGEVDDMVMAFVGLVHAEDQVKALRKDKATWQKLQRSSFAVATAAQK